MTLQRRVLGFCLHLAIFGVFVAPPATAQQTPPRTAQRSQAGPSVASLTQGYETRKGFLTLYVNMKKHHVLAEISGRLIGKRFLLATSIAGGSYTGWQWDDRMVFWERLDKKLVLVEPEIRYKAGSSTLAEVVKRTYRDRVITAVPILAEGQAGSVLIDLSNLLAARSTLFIGSLGSGMDASLTKIAQAKAFPRNVELEFDLARSGATGSARGLAVHYSISELPSTSYRPRQADDRIGYFLTAHVDFSKDPRAEDRFVRYVNRWHLEKADPNLALSPPKEPIIFYIEKTVPIRYRRYVQEGILEWNRAFEKIGILDAIIVAQQTDTRHNEKDPEDVNYNFFRWITSESSFAMGPSRVHPETGQILDADIIFDDAMLRSWLAEYDRLIQEGPAREFHPAVSRYLEENPHRHPMRRWRSRTSPVNTEPLSPDLADAPGLTLPEDYGLVGLGRPSARRRGEDIPLCEYGHGVRHQLNFGLTVLRALAASELSSAEDPGKGPNKDDWPEEFVGQVLKEVVMHEVGHTLGLRHNFKASSWLTLEQINSPDGSPEATTGSVMDYNPTNISPKGKPQGNWNTRTLGPYDFWAIEYGYTLEQDPKKLAKIAQRGAGDGLAYATDEDTYSSDPLVVRFDLGREPLDYARRRMRLSDQVLKNLLTQVVKDGQGYQPARQAFSMLLYEYLDVASMAAQYVGGNYIHRDHKGDPNERPPLQPVEVEKQREALDLLCNRVFADTAFQFPPDILNYLAVGRWYHWGSNDSSNDPEYPVHDRILQVQLWTLFELLNPRTFTLIEDGELRVPKGDDALTIPELLAKLTDSIWSEVWNLPPGEYTNRNPMVSSIRRNLQHEYVGQLIDLALEGDYGASPQSARKQAYFQLRRLGAALREAAERVGSDGGPSKLDQYTHAHLLETSKRIEQALSATYSRSGGGGSSAGFIILGRPSNE